MQKVFSSLLAVIFLLACNGTSNDGSNTADSLTRAPTIDTVDRTADC